MSTLKEIITAVDQLSPRGLAKLRRHLDRLEEKEWQTELTKLAAARKRRGITDEQIDDMIARRRRENRR